MDAINILCEDSLQVWYNVHVQVYFFLCLDGFKKFNLNPEFFSLCSPTVSFSKALVYVRGPP